MKKVLLSLLVSGVILGATLPVQAQNMPFDAGGGGKTIYGPWKKSPTGLFGYVCSRTIYYKSGSKKVEQKWIPLGFKC
ncbi:hypothetical protein RHD99_15930 [Buttiauxella selenatireducens]|uniref:Antimicrobial protein n=1 Tax=Buttiauxella selenatireducens TaxID=3073902 RepID=A0ABY9S7C7_9ENTR|nr:hypothetical protein [Buttiauxella sp. R73]WMY72950.1 hypothetical protein RHD99_15930 [Buttiauxella sp. R73]